MRRPAQQVAYFPQTAQPKGQGPCRRGPAGDRNQRVRSPRQQVVAPERVKRAPTGTGPHSSTAEQARDSGVGMH